MLNSRRVRAKGSIIIRIRERERERERRNVHTISLRKDDIQPLCVRGIIILKLIINRVCWWGLDVYGLCKYDGELSCAFKDEDVRAEGLSREALSSK